MSPPACAVCIAGLFGIYPPGFVAQVVAFAFGLAAASFFPCILMGIFNKKANKEGALAGMFVGIVFVAAYIIYFKFVNPAFNNKDRWWFGISPEGIGTVGAALNFIVACTWSASSPRNRRRRFRIWSAASATPASWLLPPSAGH